MIFLPWTGFWFYALHSNSLTFPNHHHLQYKDSSLQYFYTMLTNGLLGNNMQNDKSHTPKGLVFSNTTVTTSHLASPIREQHHVAKTNTLENIQKKCKNLYYS